MRGMAPAIAALGCFLELVGCDRLPPCTLLPGQHESRLPGVGQVLDCPGEKLPSSPLGVEDRLHVVVEVVHSRGDVLVMLKPQLEKFGYFLPGGILRFNLPDLLDRIAAAECQ